MPKIHSSALSFKNKMSSVVATVLVVGLVSTIVLLRQGETFKRASAAPVPVSLEQSVDGGAAGVKTVSTSGPVTAQAGNVYLASIGMKPYREVNAVSGMGLTWTRLKNQCGARGASGAEVWKGTGTPTSDVVTATFTKAPANSVISVSRFANPDPTNPIGTVFGMNTKGLNGDCTGGTDSKAYSFDFLASPNSITFAAVSERSREHTSGASFAESAEYHFGKESGDVAGLALISQNNSTGGTQKVAGTFSNEVDWSIIAVQVNGQAGSGAPTTTSAPTATPVGGPVVTPTATPKITPGPTTSTATPWPDAPPTSAVKGIWTSPQELASKPMSGPAWEGVLKGANDLPADPNPNLDNQDDNTNVQVLAAAIVYVRSGNTMYKDKVVRALQKVEVFEAKGRSLAWGRETGAYAMAADLIGYRTPAFEAKMRQMADGYICTQQKTTLFGMYKNEPTNWGAMAFASLSAIYVYLGDTAKLKEVHDIFVQKLNGPAPSELKFDKDITWMCDENNPRIINPAGCVKQCNGSLVDVSGIIPEDMRRGASCQANPAWTNYPWGALEGYVTGARVMERAGLSVWRESNSAICRAAAVLQEGRFGTSWKAEGNDQWQLPVLDKACGKNWSAGTGTDGKPYGKGLWESGKAGGWSYVVN